MTPHLLTLILLGLVFLSLIGQNIRIDQLEQEVKRLKGQVIK